MLVNGVSLFDNRFKNYNRTSLNKEFVSFSAKKPEIPKEVTETVLDRIKKGKISERGKRFLKELEEARKKGELEPDTVEGPPPGWPDDTPWWP